MGGAFRCFPTAPSIKANISMESLKASESISGPMANSIKASGSMASSMAQACGRGPKVIVMSENGGWARLKVTEYTSGSMAIGTKETSRIV